MLCSAAYAAERSASAAAAGARAPLAAAPFVLAPPLSRSLGRCASLAWLSLARLHCTPLATHTSAARSARRELHGAKSNSPHGPPDRDSQLHSRPAERGGARSFARLLAPPPPPISPSRSTTTTASMGDSPTLGRTDTRAAACRDDQESPVVPARLVGGGAGARRPGRAAAHDGAAAPAPSPPAQSRLARRSRSPAREHDSTCASSSPPPHSRATSTVASATAVASANVGLGLGLPVELDELLEAGEAFAGLGARASARFLPVLAGLEAG